MDITSTLTQCRWLRHVVHVEDLRDCEDEIFAWQNENECLAPHGLGIACECVAGYGCDLPATLCSDGVALCAGCDEESAWDADGNSDCGCCGVGTSMMWDSRVGCSGAYVFVGEIQEPSPTGDWEVWWVTTPSSDDYCCAKYDTEDAADSAASRANIALGGTNLLCGYEVISASLMSE